MSRLFGKEPDGTHVPRFLVGFRRTNKKLLLYSRGTDAEHRGV